MPRAGCAAKTAATARSRGFPGRDPAYRWSRPSRSSPGPRGRRAPGRNILHGRCPAARPATGLESFAGRSADQGRGKAEDLPLDRLARRRPGPAAEGLRRRPHQSQSQHQPPVLSPHLHDAHVTRSAGHAGRRAQAGLEICSGGIVGMGEEDEDVVELALRVGNCGPRPCRSIFSFPLAGTRWTAGRPAQTPLLPEGAGPVPPGQSPRRTAHRRRPRAAPGPLAAAGTVCGQLDVRGRLSHGQRASRRKKITG